MDEEYAEELPENIFSKQEQSGPEMAEKIPAKMGDKILLLIRTRSIILKACREKIICMSERPDSSVL